ncbi:MAG TPA: hypothetical protein VJ770_22365 [Stellaceae bacterium]|nr:hypothetical protein [Stellaceae bacterium]
MALITFIWCAGGAAGWAQVPIASQRDTCPAPPTHVEVKTRVTPVAVSTDLTLGQINAMAQRSRQPLRHMPYGFYLGRVWYAFVIHEAPGTVQGCAPGFQIDADLALIDRHIEIASDLKANTCRFQTVLKHYEDHANADKRAFNEFAATVPTRVHAVLAGMAPKTPIGKNISRLDVNAAFNKVLAVMDTMRQTVQAAVDNPSEVARLTHPSCAV